MCNRLSRQCAEAILETQAEELGQDEDSTEVTMSLNDALGRCGAGVDAEAVGMYMQFPCMGTWCGKDRDVALARSDACVHHVKTKPSVRGAPASNSGLTRAPFCPHMGQPRRGASARCRSLCIFITAQASKTRLQKKPHIYIYICIHIHILHAMSYVSLTMYMPFYMSLSLSLSLSLPLSLSISPGPSSKPAHGPRTPSGPN